MLSAEVVYVVQNYPKCKGITAVKQKFIAVGLGM